LRRRRVSWKEKEKEKEIKKLKETRKW